MVLNFARGGAAINVLARHAGAEVVVVDMGVAGELAPAPAIRWRAHRAGHRELGARPGDDRARRRSRRSRPASSSRASSRPTA